MSDDALTLVEQGPAERRRHPRKAIRLRIRYRSAESLVTEYTTCISKGGCALVTDRAIEVGAHFAFEMFIHGEDEPVEIDGEVVRVRPIEAQSPKFEIGVQYVAVNGQRERLDRVLARILVDPTFKVVRRHPRIPVNLIAHGTDRPPHYLVRDLSHGGMRVEATGISSDISVGFKAMLTVQLTTEHCEPCTIVGEVVWMHPGSLLVRARLGIQFTTLAIDQLKIIDGLTRLFRPHSLALRFLAPFAKGTSPDVELAPTRELCSSDEIRPLIESFAIQFLEEEPFLGLSVVDEAWPSSGGDFARVGFVGDVDGEVMAQVEPEVGARVATTTMGDEVSSSNHDLIADSITEWISTLAGFVCDRLDELGIELEVTAPIPGFPVRSKDERVSRVVLRGVYGSVALTIVTRDVSACPILRSRAPSLCH